MAGEDQGQARARRPEPLGQRWVRARLRTTRWCGRPARPNQGRGRQGEHGGAERAQALQMPDGESVGTMAVVAVQGGLLGPRTRSLFKEYRLSLPVILEDEVWSDV